MATDNKANPYYAGDMLDIIFENRNKSYGAYDLRRNYPNFIRKALIGGLLIAALLVAIPFITRAISDATEKKDVEVKVELGPPPSINPNEPPPPPPPKVETPPPTVATEKFVPPVVKKDEEVTNEEPPPAQEDLKNKAVSTKTQEGDPDAKVPVKAPDLGPPKDVEPPKPKEPEKEEPLMFAEQMPEFPGGQVELQKYLASNIKYPAVARETGIEGNVVLQFIIDKSGKIKDIKVAKDIGGGCGAEAVRVVSSMPQWKAGIKKKNKNQ